MKEILYIFLGGLIICILTDSTILKKMWESLSNLLSISSYVNKNTPSKTMSEDIMEFNLTQEEIDQFKKYILGLEQKEKEVENILTA